MALRSRLPIIGSALFLLLGAAAYFLPTFVPYLAINGINIVEHKDLIAIGLGAVAAILLLISFFTGRKAVNEEDEEDDSDEPAFFTEDTSVPVLETTGFEGGYDVPEFDNTVEEFVAEPKVKLTAAEKRALKAAAKAEKKRQKEEAKFAKQAAKEAAKAAKAAAKAAKKGAVVDSEILDEETGTDWYKDDDFLAQTVTDAPVAEEASADVDTAEPAAEITDENWTDAAYSDPNFEVPFAEEIIESVEVTEDVAVEATDEEVTEENPEVAALKAQVMALESALAQQAETTQLALLELSESTRSNSTARLEWLKDMVEKNNFGDDVVLRMIDMLIRQSKADEGTVHSALSALDLNK